MLDFIHHLVGGIQSFIFNYQSLLAGLIALVAAYLAAKPVWRQIEISDLQSRIMLREALASRLREARERYLKVESSLVGTLTDLDRLTHEQDGEKISIDSHCALEIEQKLRGTLDWYLLTLKDTEIANLENDKSNLKIKLDSLTDTLICIYTPDIYHQGDIDDTLSDSEWKDVHTNSIEAEKLVQTKLTDVMNAFLSLQGAQNCHIKSLQEQISYLDFNIAKSRP